MPIRSASRLLRLFFLVVIVLAIFVLYFQRAPHSEPSRNPRYFQEIIQQSQTRHTGANTHFDARYATQQEKLTPVETHTHLLSLLKSFAAFSDEHDLEFWIAHGTLLGWCWNQELLPWDTDVDVQVSAPTLTAMARDLNGSIYPSVPMRHQRLYALDVNPFWNDTSAEDTANRIDARWIDMVTGRFLDITAVHAESGEDREMLYCKDGHRYKVE